MLSTIVALKAKLTSIDWSRKVNLPLYIWVGVIFVALASYHLLPEGGKDWRHDIGPAARHWWPAPWEEGLTSPPWTALLVSPIGLLPDRWATAFTNGLSVLVFALTARKLNAPEWVGLLVLITPFGIWMFGNGQTEWLVMICLLLPVGYDLPFILIKPQMALWLAVPRLRQSRIAWRRYLVSGVVTVLLSLLIWPLWPLHIYQGYANVLLSGYWNYSTWPWGIPIGLFLAGLAWRSKSDGWGLAASPFMFPYVNGASYVGAALALAARWPKFALLGWLAIWFVFTVYALNA